jgi:CO/xanthine dehydrogenase FAD-binding subunit
MKPASFDYIRPKTIEEAVAALATGGGDAKVLAGGQSLVPMLNFRIANPQTLVDLNRIDGMRYLVVENGRLRIGMLARHLDLETDPKIMEQLPLLSHVAKSIAHRAIRNRGTFVGSVCHNDPSAEWPLMCTLLDAEMILQSPRGTRSVAAKDFFVGYLTTALAEDELVSEISLTVPDAGDVWGFHEFARRKGDFAIASAAAVLRVVDGKVQHARLSVGGVGASAYRDERAETVLIGHAPTTDLLRSAADAVSENADPTSDLHATAEYRRHLVGEMAMRALKDAAEKADRQGGGK